MIGEHRLAALHGGEMQQPDIDPTSLARVEPLSSLSQARRKTELGNSPSRNTECRKACGFLIRAPIRWR